MDPKDIDSMFGPPGVEHPVITKMEYKISSKLCFDKNMEDPSALEMNYTVSLSGSDIIASLKGFCLSGDVKEPYPSHIRNIASMGRSTITVETPSTDNVER